VLKRFSLLIFIFLFVAVLAGFSLWWESGLKPVDSSGMKKVSFVITRGETVRQIALRLREATLIQDPLSFKLFVLFTGLARKIQAGSYQFSPSQSTPDIVGILARGVKDQKVTIIEGLRQEQIGEFLAGKGFPIDQREWQQEIVVKKLEGELFPDTYSFPQAASQGAILKIIDRNFQKKVSEGLADKISSSGLSLSQILTLASIVERESRSEDDRHLVAGILLKRWSKDWVLQADATVQYAVASRNCEWLSFSEASEGKEVTNELEQKSGGCEWWPKSLTEKDLNFKSSYNTYLNPGLPPGPICNPGLFAIEAVLDPLDSPYWYFISDKEGVMHYAKTDTEQAENIQKYLY